MKSIKELVSEKLVTEHNGDFIKSRVVEVLAREEVERRVDATVKVTKLLQEAELVLKKLNKPDIVSYNADGSEASTAYSKARLDEIKKATDHEKKIISALERAFLHNDFEKVYELAK